MKKVLCLMLISMLTFGVVGNVFAASPDISETKMKQMEEDIKSEIEISRKEIYRQLEQQDALVLMEVYEDIIYPQIEQQIKAEYMGQPSYQLNATYYAPNGGLVTYLSPLSGYQPTEVAVTCLNRDDSYDYLLNEYSFKPINIISSILGYIPYLGEVSSLVLDIRGIADSAAISKINEANGYAEIINTYSREWGTKASLVTGWSDRYYISVPSSATNVTFTRF